MKFLYFIFSFYILLLPYLQCTDFDDCCVNAPIEIATSISSHIDHQNEKKSCNPLCSCACCVQIFYSNFQLEKKSTAKPLDELKQTIFYKKYSHSSAYLSNIWQPPRYS